MFRELQRNDPEVDGFFNLAYDKVYVAPGLSEEERQFYLGATKALEWILDEDASEPRYEDE